MRSLSVSALLVAALAACGGAPSAPTSATAPSGSSSATTTGSPADVARALFDAARADDEPGVARLFTAKARAGLESGSFDVDLIGREIEGVEIGAAAADADTASVPVHATVDGESQHMALKMRREDGAWRVHGFGVLIDGVEAFAVDLESFGEAFEAIAEGFAEGFAESFEQAFADMSQGGSAEEIARDRERFTSITTLSIEQHRAAWQVDVHVVGRSAIDVLEELVRDQGLALDGEGAADELARPIDLELTGVSRAEAVERVCAAAGVHPIWPEAVDTFGTALGQGLAAGVGAFAEELGLPTTDSGARRGPTITFAVGPRPWPVAFTGPFLVEVEEVTEEAPHAAGTLTLAVRALGLAPACLAFHSEMVELLRIDAIVDAAGASLDADDGVTFFGTPSVVGGYLVDRTHLDLCNLLRRVEHIARLTGDVRLRLPSEVLTVRVDEETEEAVVDGVTLRREAWGTTTTFGVEAEDTERMEVRFSPLAHSGEPVGTLMSDSSAWNGRVHASVQTPVAPAVVEMKVCTVETEAYAFVLERIPLRRYAEQPIRLAPLSFEGEVPVVIEFERFVDRDGDFPQISVRVHNRSNKDVRVVQADLVYVDAAGAELERFPHTLNGPFGPGGARPFAAGRSEALETTAFFMPEATATVRVVVDEVELVDRSTWKRAE